MLDILLSGQLAAAALVTGALYALVALGLNLVYGTMRLLNVAHGDLVMVGGYVAYWAFTLWGVSPLVALAAAAALCAGLALALYQGLLRRVLGATRGFEQIEARSLLVFFAFSIILQNTAALAFSASLRGYRYLDQLVVFGGVQLTASRVAAFVVAAALVVAVALFLRFNIFGLAVRALIQNRDAAAVVGVNLDRVQGVSLALGFALAGVAGALVSMSEQISPFMGFPFTISAFVIIILGGLGNVGGGILGGLILGMLETYGVALTSPHYRSVVVYGVLILVLFVRPEGLLGHRRIAR